MKSCCESVVSVSHPTMYFDHSHLYCLTLLSSPLHYFSVNVIYISDGIYSTRLSSAQLFRSRTLLKSSTFQTKKRAKKLHTQQNSWWFVFSNRKNSFTISLCCMAQLWFLSIIVVITITMVFGKFWNWNRYVKMFLIIINCRVVNKCFGYEINSLLKAEIFVLRWTTTYRVNCTWIIWWKWNNFSSFYAREEIDTFQKWILIFELSREFGHHFSIILKNYILHFGIEHRFAHFHSGAKLVLFKVGMGCDRVQKKYT